VLICVGPISRCFAEYRLLEVRPVNANFCNTHNEAATVVSPTRLKKHALVEGFSFG